MAGNGENSSSATENSSLASGSINDREEEQKYVYVLE